MEFMSGIWEIVNHLDNYIQLIVTDYGLYTYLFLFLLVMLETNFVLTPILPGVTVIFAASAISATGKLDPFLIFALCSVAVFIGDISNYMIGRKLGKSAYKLSNRFISPVAIETTERFFHKHGRTTMYLARYIPLIRTFATFVAGIVKMKFSVFVVSCLFSAMIYIGLYVVAGYFFGHIPFVQNNLTITLFIVAFATLIPAGYKGLHKYLQHKKRTEVS
jgi:membrane-associated protein